MLVSHQLEEVLEHTDRVTVLRDGRVVGSGLRTGELSEHELIRLMLGRELQGRRQRRKEARSGVPPAAEACGLRGYLVKDATVIEIGSEGVTTDKKTLANYIDLRGTTSVQEFVAAIAAGDLHVGPVSAPVGDRLRKRLGDPDCARAVCSFGL